MEKKEYYIDKANARVLWNCDKEGKISDLIVAEFSSDENPQYLYNKYRFDIGNCLKDWDKWTNAYIIYRMFLTQEFSSIEIRNRAFHELERIKEIRKELMDGIKYDPAS
jgi:hypothetical protein